MKHSITLLLLLCCTCALAQPAGDGGMEQLFAARVKTFDEFLARLNGRESFPGIDEADPLSRRKNILALFDFQGRDDKQAYFADITAFADSLLGMGRPVEVDDPLLFAEAVCQMEWEKKPCRLSLILKQESTSTGLRKWSIAGVADLFDALDIPTGPKRAISPVENEINFMELATCVNDDREHILSYVADDRQVDGLSFLLGLMRSGQLRLVQCEEVVYHLLAVPGYYCRVSETHRRDTNSGWLVTTLRQMNASEKETTVRRILGKD